MAIQSGEKRKVIKSQIDVEEEFKRIQATYMEESATDTFNALIYGKGGTGKTFLTQTMPKPILIHSFDPGGTVTLRQHIKNPESGIYVQKFEDEDANNPTQFRAWEKEFNRLRNSDFFSSIGTYVIDSITMWDEALMNAILFDRGRKGEPPQLQDYRVEILTVIQYIKIATGLPCNFIAIGHQAVDKDEETGRMLVTPMVTGQLKTKLPLLFDEVYVTTVKQSSSGSQYSLLTQNDGFHMARSRLAAGGLLDKYEDPDISKILEKTGFNS